MYYPMYIQLPNVSTLNIDLTLPPSPRFQSFLIQMALVLYNGFWIYIACLKKKLHHIYKN